MAEAEEGVAEAEEERRSGRGRASLRQAVAEEDRRGGGPSWGRWEGEDGSDERDGMKFAG